MRAVMLCGGLGGARLAPWLAARFDLTVVANVADDTEFMGMHVSPDLDSVLYALAGLFDDERGFGVRGDSFSFLDLAERAGLERWFAVGDRDLQTHMLRTAWLQRGVSLSEATRCLTAAFGVSTIFPATDDRVRTRIVLPDGEVSFQTFFVRYRANGQVIGVRMDGLEDARPAPGVLPAIDAAHLVVIAESSPVASVLPILDLPGMRQALVRTSATRIALSPMVMATPPVRAVDLHHWNAREVLMRTAGLDHRPDVVARLYLGLIDVFVLDRRDRGYMPAVRNLGLEVREAELLDRAPAPRRRLAGLLRRLSEERLRRPSHLSGSSVSATSS